MCQAAWQATVNSRFYNVFTWSITINRSHCSRHWVFPFLLFISSEDRDRCYGSPWVRWLDSLFIRISGTKHHFVPETVCSTSKSTTKLRCPTNNHTFVRFIIRVPLSSRGKERKAGVIGTSDSDLWQTAVSLIFWLQVGSGAEASISHWEVLFARVRHWIRRVVMTRSDGQRVRYWQLHLAPLGACICVYG